MRGHVAPAAHSRGYPSGRELAVALDDGTQLARCLRCDAWVHTQVPESREVLTELPRPLRGKALDELVVIRVIALERGFHVVLFLSLALVLFVLELGLPALQEQARQIISVLDQTRAGHPAITQELNAVLRLDGGHLWVLIAIALGYAVLEGVEAVYLWKGKRWAEYLTVLATSLLLPLEIYELTEKVTFFRVTALLVNLLILFYLIWTKRLFGVRGGQPALDAELAADTDWEQLHRHAPLSPGVR